MTKKTGKAIMLLGAVLILAALALITYNHYEASAAERNANEVMSDMLDLIGDSAHISSLPIPETLETISIDGHEYIGYISIPTLELSLPVMAQWSYPNLKIAPCYYYGSIKNALVIAAHNYEHHFGKLKQLKPGDEVLFIDVNGRAYKYEIAQVEILEPTAIDEMISTQWDLTLFTCTFGGQSRVTARCVRAQ